MNIIIIGPANPYRGGIAALNERLAIQLMEEGHQVEMINFSLQYPSFLFPGKTQFTTTQAPPQLVIKRMINAINPFNWLITGWKLRKQKPDLVLVRFWLPMMGPSTGTICKLIRSNKHSKIIAIVDNLIPHEKRPGDALFTRYFVNQTHGLIALSDCVYQDLDLFRKNRPKKLTPHPIYDHYGEILPKQAALQLLNLDPSHRYVLFFGFIRDYKGLDLLLEALADERLEHHNIRLIVAGEFYANEEKYLKLIADLKLTEKVHLYTGYIPDSEINRYFCAADLITQPYKSATQSGVTQIGFHFNKPMLVTKVGGLPEIIAHNQSGYVVDPAPEAIADAILDFYEHERESLMVAAVEKEKKRFGWDNLTNTIFEIKKLCS
ncbi:MAG: glycosyltransferase [Prolixibacteraceae bacterium]|nr:glycosyltransferase [Prolixibacteraceae bacterium]